MRLTLRDVRVVEAVHRCRVLRREQIERLLFPSKNTANARLKRLHQHGYLARRRLPVEQGQGSSQALYLLATRGAQLVAERLGVDVAEIGWSRSRNHVTPLFLEHTLMVNDIRVAIERAAARQGYSVSRWLTEDELKVRPDRLWVPTGHGGQRRIALVPDAYCCLEADGRRAHFLLEADRATEAHGRWAQKVAAYLAYVRSGAYGRRYGTECLRVLTVTTSETRLRNLLRTTEQAQGGAMFWFTHLGLLAPATVLQAPVWYVPGQPDPTPLITAQPDATPALSGAPLLLYRS
jgi:hypothetical protein